ncbi:MAG: lytic transglycosylase domain-containing protein, partial [Chloroflexota bacterium]|nr:lytic transglycosylase domain-containing protein [Chloroflexota bacterium]
MAVAVLAGMAPHLEAQTLRDRVAMTMRIPEHARVQRYAKYYASPRQRPWLREVMQRVGFYGDHILARVEHRDLPPELIFLPVIESGYESTATSPAGAVGLWQLMGRTARENGLDTDGVVDERRDFWKATEVALRILQANYGDLGSWELALAAYNAGSWRVRAAVRRSGTRDFWELREQGYLPRETREYVPRYYGLLAALRSLPEKEWPRLEGQPRWRRTA